MSNPRFKTRKKGFVKMWNSGYFTVITKMRTNCFEYRGAPISEKKPTQFVRDKDVHHLMKSEDDIDLITTFEKLINVLEDHSEELSIFAEEENISVDNGADLSRLVDYYYQLSDKTCSFLVFASNLNSKFSIEKASKPIYGKLMHMD